MMVMALVHRLQIVLPNIFRLTVVWARSVVGTGTIAADEVLFTNEVQSKFGKKAKFTINLTTERRVRSFMCRFLGLWTNV